MQISPAIIGIVSGAVIVIWLIVVFNSLVALRNRLQNAWSQIDLQLKRRHDLIPNLVETVRASMQHERTVFEDVVHASAGNYCR
jgi:LemA protein